MSDEPSIVTSVVMPGRERPELREPIIVSVEENAARLSLRDALIAEPRLGGVTLCIESRDGELVISGAIESDDQRILVLDIASQFAQSIVDKMDIADQSPDFCEA